MTKCDICGKSIQVGHLIRHTHTGLWEKRATKNPRAFKPNLHRGKVLLSGQVKRVKACASCLARYGVKYTPKVLTAPAA